MHRPRQYLSRRVNNLFVPSAACDVGSDSSTVTALDKKPLSFGEGTIDFIIVKPAQFLEFNLLNFEGTLDFL